VNIIEIASDPKFDPRIASVAALKSGKKLEELAIEKTRGRPAKRMPMKAAKT